MGSYHHIKGLLNGWEQPGNVIKVFVKIGLDDAPKWHDIEDLEYHDYQLMHVHEHKGNAYGIFKREGGWG